MVDGREWPSDVNLADHLLWRHLREGRGAAVALHYEASVLTYVDVAAMVKRAVSALERAGTMPGDRVLLLLGDTPAFVAAFFGVLHVGAVAVPLSPTLSCDNASEISRRIRPRLCLTDDQFVDKYAAVGLGLERVSRFLEASDEDRPLSEAYRAVDAVAYCLFSSGTTGTPKGIPHRHVDIGVHTSLLAGDPSNEL